jgi:hypothetical protein
MQVVADLVVLRDAPVDAGDLQETVVLSELAVCCRCKEDSRRKTRAMLWSFFAAAGPEMQKLELDTSNLASDAPREAINQPQRGTVTARDPEESLTVEDQGPDAFEVGLGQVTQDGLLELQQGYTCLRTDAGTNADIGSCPNNIRPGRHGVSLVLEDLSELIGKRSHGSGGLVGFQNDYFLPD